MEKSYHDALEAAVSQTGADGSQLSAWVESLRRADDRLDSEIAKAVRNGDSEEAQKVADLGNDLQAVADFLQRLYDELEGG